MKAKEIYHSAVAYFFEKPGYDRDFYDNFLPLLGRAVAGGAAV